MTNEPKIICFDSGLQIVAEVEEAETLDAIGVIKVHYPLEILRVPMSMTHEETFIRPWTSVPSATVLDVNNNNVIAMAQSGEVYEA